MNNIPNNFEHEHGLRSIDSFVDSINRDAHGNYTKSYESWKRLTNVLKSVAREVSRLKHDNIKVLDLGCGNGHFLFLINKLKEVQGKNIAFHGVDISKFEIELAKRTAEKLEVKNMKFETINIEKDNVEEATYDIVINTDVIEHLVEPEKCVEKIYRLLKPNGLAIITTPNSDNTFIDMLRFLLGKGKRQINTPVDKNAPTPPDGYGHISVKSKKEWCKIFRKQGFALDYIRRGSLVFGGPRYNDHPIIFSLLMFVDQICDYLFFMKSFSEALTYNFRKPRVGVAT